MNIMSFDEVSAQEAVSFLPADYFYLFKKNELKGAVAYFAKRLVGAVAWKAKDKTAELLSIYVAPEARRLGVGTDLLQDAVQNMKKAGCSEIHFKYSEYGDRTSLAPFFNNNGFETDVDEIPLGKKPLSEMIAGVGKKGVDKAKGEGACIFEMDGREKAAAKNALTEMSDQDIDIYDKQWPGTYVIMDGAKVLTAAFLREEGEGTISIDYLFNSGTSKDLASLLRRIIERIGDHYPGDTEVEMLLATESGEKLYEAMFGKADSFFRMAVCNQSI